MTYDASKVAFVDTETLGLDPDYHPVWEIAVITEAGEHSWFQRVGSRALRDAEPEALKMTGFHDRYRPVDALEPRASIDRFNSLTKDRHLVGMCPWFDSERLHRAHRGTLPASAQLAQRRHPWHYHLIDIETLIVGYNHGTGSSAFALPWESRALVKSIGVDLDDPRFQPAHRALTDARLAKACLDKMTGTPL